MKLHLVFDQFWAHGPKRRKKFKKCKTLQKLTKKLLKEWPDEHFRYFYTQRIHWQAHQRQQRPHKTAEWMITEFFL